MSYHCCPGFIGEYMVVKTKSIQWFIALLAAPLLLSCQGCYEPPERQPMDANFAYQLIADQVRKVLGGMTDDFQVIEDFGLARRLYSLAHSGVSCSAGTDGEECVVEPGPDELNLEFDEIGQNLLQLVKDYVLVPAQIESEGNGVMVLLKPDVFCQVFSNGDSEEPDSARGCRDFLSAVPVRLDFYSYWSESLNIDVLIGDERMFVFEIQLWGEGIYMDLDMGSITPAMEMVKDLFKPDGEPLFESLSGMGRLSMYVHRDYNNIHYLHAEVYNQFELELVLSDGTYRVELESGIVNIWADSDIEEFEVAVHLQDMELSFPFQVLADLIRGSDAEAVPAAGTTWIRSDGLSFSAQGKPAEGTIVVSNLGIGNGPTTISRDFDTLLGIHLNRDEGHVLSLTLSQDLDGRIKAAVSDVFDLLIDWNLGLAAADLNEVPAGKDDETWRVLLDGVSPAVKIMEGVNGEWLKVLSGGLTLSSSAWPANSLVASADQCISVTDDQTHPLLSIFAVGECVAP